MNNLDRELIGSLCKTYQLGKIISEPIACPGGLTHRIYQLDTAIGRFVIKFLNPASTNPENDVNSYRISEKIAKKLGKYINAIHAITHHGDPLFSVGNNTIMLFPYINGRTLEQNEITSLHVSKMGQALQQIHQANIKIDHAPAVEFPTLNLSKWMQLRNKKSILINEVLEQLTICLPAINAVYENCQKYQSMFKNNTVISHRDCDPKNVLWDTNNNYYIIDWEAAGLINKTKDLVATAIYWCLDDQFNLNSDHLSTFLNSYQKNQEIIKQNEIEAGFYGLLGDWLGWLDFNLSRLLNNPEESTEFNLGTKESKNTLTAIPILLEQFRLIIKIFADNALVDNF